MLVDKNDADLYLCVQGEEELMWDIMKECLFHGNDMPLRYPEAGGHK